MRSVASFLRRSATRGFSTKDARPGEMGRTVPDPANSSWISEQRAVIREGDWVCQFPLCTPLVDAARIVLRKAGWAPHEIEREIAEIRKVSLVEFYHLGEALCKVEEEAALLREVQDQLHSVEVE